MQIIVNGLILCSVYALIALGYTMVYGIIKLINFAHGDILMIGAYAVLVAVSNGMPLVLALILSIIFVNSLLFLISLSILSQECITVE